MSKNSLIDLQMESLVIWYVLGPQALVSIATMSPLRASKSSEYLGVCSIHVLLNECFSTDIISLDLPIRVLN